jgi:hypothetical protein
LAEVQTLLLSARLGNKKEPQREGQQSLSFCRILPRLLKPLSMFPIFKPFYFLCCTGFSWQPKDVILGGKYKDNVVSWGRDSFSFIL